jgi:hypothetical protein
MASDFQKLLAFAIDANANGLITILGVDVFLPHIRRLQDMALRVNDVGVMKIG